jgi:molybdenum cofactor cytidylyltransferase
MIAALLLAAGESKRMGHPKLLLSYQGKSLLSHAIAKSQKVSGESYVVVGAYTELYSAEAEQAGANVIINHDWREGLASSLRIGVATLQEAEAILVLLPDQPFVPNTHLNQLITTWRETGASLVLSHYKETLGAPCLIDKRLFHRVSELRGDRGARALIGPDVAVAQVELEHSQDIDTPEDTALLENPED